MGILRWASLAVVVALGGALACSSGKSSAGGGAGGRDAGATGGSAGNAGGGSAQGGNASGGSGQGGSASGGSAGQASGGAGGAVITTHDCKNPDPNWLLCEDFEGMSAGFDNWLANSVWTENIGGKNPGRMTSSTDAHTGKYSVYYPAAASAGYQGADLIYRTCAGTNKPGCTLKGYNQLYFRTYVKLATDHLKVHHFLAIAGSRNDAYWESYGNAGCRPNGSRWMGTTVDLKPNTHATYFYTYFPSMHCDPGSTCQKYANPTQICNDCATKNMPCENGLECCWGNNFMPSTEVDLPLGKWVCLEMMMRANDVGKSNGEMAYWVDNKLVEDKTGMHWRDTDTLTLNEVRLQHYLTTSDAGNHSNRVWFDDVVVSTKRIGCMTP